MPENRYINAEAEAPDVYFHALLPEDHRLRPHFLLDEFRCDKELFTVLNPRFLDLCELIRVRVGMPVTINSSFRTWGHHVRIYQRINSKAKKAANKSGKRFDPIKPPTGSAHLFGAAGDFACADMKKLEEVITEISCGGIGLYDTFIHADVHGENRRWDKRTTS